MRQLISYLRLPVSYRDSKLVHNSPTAIFKTFSSSRHELAPKFNQDQAIVTTMHVSNYLLAIGAAVSALPFGPTSTLTKHNISSNEIQSNTNQAAGAISNNPSLNSGSLSNR